MLKLGRLLIFALLISGCAVTGVLVDTAGGGELERVYEYPYKRVFYAADAAANSIGEFVQWYTKETNFEKGSISLNGGMPPLRVTVLVEKVDDKKTVVKIKKYTNNVIKYLRSNFFQNLGHLLKDN